MTIRRVQDADVGEIELLLNELGYQISTEALSMQLELYSQPGSIVLVAESHEKSDKVSFVSGHLIPLLHQHGSVGRITAMVVSEDSHGSGVGVGIALIEQLETWFCETRCRRYEVTSAEHRIRAHLFYEKLGYISAERRFIKIP